MATPEEKLTIIETNRFSSKVDKDIAQNIINYTLKTNTSGEYEELEIDLKKKTLKSDEE